MSKSKIEKKGNGLFQGLVIANVRGQLAFAFRRGGLVQQGFPQGFHYLFGVVVVPCLKLNARHVERHTIISEIRK